MFDTTVVIVARNAETTIERTIRSALAPEECAILLVDDQSDDRTVERVIATGGSRLRVRTAGQHRTLGEARQRALEAVGTEFSVLLDAASDWGNPTSPGSCSRSR